MKYKLAIFDLDGTILDTIDDLADSLNHVLATNNLPAHSADDTRKMVGNGIKNLVIRGCPMNSSNDTINKVYMDMMSYYKIHCAEKTKPYNGIINVIKTLRKAGLYTAVVSNKADEPVKILCEKYFQGLFDYTVGERTGIAKKPSPESVNEVLAHFGCSASDAVYIGDSEVDITTSRNASMDHIIVGWGFRDMDFLIANGAMVTAASPNDILTLMEVK